MNRKVYIIGYIPIILYFIMPKRADKTGGNKMGLDITLVERKNIARIRFAYSEFGYFRELLAKSVKIQLCKMCGFTIKHKSKAWTGKEPFYEILYHSDCEDELSHDDCAKLMKDFKIWDKKITALFIKEEPDFLDNLIQLKEMIKECAEDINENMIIEFM